MHVEAARGPAGRSAHGREAARRLVAGLALAAGAVAVSALAARLQAPDPFETRQDRASHRALTLAWPPLFLALAISGLHVWSSPRGPARTQALTLWGVVQTLNAVWMALGPQRLGGRLTAAAASLGASAAYAWRAGRVNPNGGWRGFVQSVAPGSRREAAKPTIH